MGSSCCDLLGKPYLYAQMNLQKFIQSLHTRAHDLDNSVQLSKKMEARMGKCSVENLKKVAAQRSDFYTQFKQQFSDFNAEFDGPYFKKVQLYYPDVATAFTQLKAKLNNNKHVLLLKKAGLL